MKYYVARPDGPAGGGETMRMLLAAAAGSGPVDLPALAPSKTGLPGAPQLSTLVNGLGFWALVAAMVGMLIGAVLWAVGHHSANYQQAYNGRKGVLVSALAALIVGAAPALISFFFNVGHGVS